MYILAPTNASSRNWIKVIMCLYFASHWRKITKLRNFSVNSIAQADNQLVSSQQYDLLHLWMVLSDLGSFVWPSTTWLGTCVTTSLYSLSFSTQLIIRNNITSSTAAAVFIWKESSLAFFLMRNLLFKIFFYTLSLILSAQMKNDQMSIHIFVGDSKDIPQIQISHFSTY